MKKILMIMLILFISITLSAWKPYSGYSIDGANGNVDITNIDEIDADNIDGEILTDGTFSTTGGVITGITSLSDGTATLSNGNLIGLSSVTFTNETAFGTTTDGSSMVDSTGVACINYIGVVNQLFVTITAYPMPITDSEGSGGHGAIKLIDFPEGMIYAIGAIGDIEITAVSGMGATSTFDMALGSATTLTNSETLANANVDFVAKVDGTLVAGADTIDLITNTPQTEDGHTTSTDVWLCVAVTDTDMTGAGSMTMTGTIVITWINTGDY